MRTGLLAAVVLVALAASGCGDDQDRGNDAAADACDELTMGNFDEAAELAEEAADHDDTWERLAEALSTLSEAEGADEVSDSAATAIVTAADECAKVDRPRIGP